MKPIDTPIEVEVPASAHDTLRRVCASKGITPSTAAAIMVAFCCRLLEETPMNEADTLPAELDFNRHIRTQNQKRADQLLGVAEKVLLEAQGIHRGMRNRSFVASPDKE